GELDGAPPAELAQQAAAALEQAGRRALAREANRSGRKLLLRSVELEPTLERRYHAARAAWRMSDLPAVSVEMRQVLDEAREAQALDGLADVYKHQQRLDEAEALVRRALELADESGSIVAKAQALFSLGRIYVVREDPVEGERLFEEARVLFAEVGDTWMQGR